MVVPKCLPAPFGERLPRDLREDAPLRAGFLRELAAISLEEIACRLGCSTSAAHRRTRAHERRCETDDSYREAVARVVDSVVRRSISVPARAVVTSG